MEYVGRELKKELKGQGAFLLGTVKSYDEVRCLFAIVYEDGATEEMDFSHIVSFFNPSNNNNFDNFHPPILQPQLHSGAVKPSSSSSSRNVGRKPKKRRRRALCKKPSPPAPPNLTLDLNQEAPVPHFSVANYDNSLLDADLNAKGGGLVCMNLDLNRNDNDVLKGNVCLDLNKDLDFNRGLDADIPNRAHFIDLNVDVNEGEPACEDTIWKEGGNPGSLKKRKERGFDLNLGLEDQIKTVEPCSHQQFNHTLEAEVNWGSQALLPSDCSLNIEQQTPVKASGSGFLDGEQRGPSIEGGAGAETLGNEIRGRRGRKRKKVMEDTPSLTETVLRRSSRRARMAPPSAQVPGYGALDAGDDSPAVSGVSEEKVTVPSNEKLEEQEVLPPKVELPPSSGSLNLEGLPALDVFSVYSFLRSFSMLLFLSPFKLGDLVASVKCNAPNLLFDSVHVSLLQTLRKHLVSLANENSQPACDCLRSLNWDLLDLITWPIFLVEYLLMHSRALPSGFDLCHLKSAGRDYYNQPAYVKIEVLQCLCDDVTEVEAIRSELNSRTQGMEMSPEFDHKMRPNRSKKRRVAADIVGVPCLKEQETDELTDCNSDECCLCKMDGNLICCDGCPAAFHARCVGVSSGLLPEGNWYCPECLLDNDKPWLKVGKSIRGAELLGTDLYGRLFYSSCGYLLVSESTDGASSLKCYKRDDLSTVIKSLKSSSVCYGDLINSICKHWHLSPVDVIEKVNDSHPSGNFSEYLAKGDLCTMRSLHSEPSVSCFKRAIIDVSENPLEPRCPDSLGRKGSVLVNREVDTLNHCGMMECERASPEVYVEGSRSVTGTHNAHLSEVDCSIKSSEFSHVCETTEKISDVGDCPLTSTSSEIEQGKNITSDPCGHLLSPIITGSVVVQEQSLSSYVNYYSFARTASLIVEHLAPKTCYNMSEDASRSVEDIISAQLRAISSIFSEFCWPNLHNQYSDARKEKCGWCFACLFPEHERDCFFIKKDKHPTPENYTSEALGVRPTKTRKGHLVDIMCRMLYIENHLQGLLLGPWLNPDYSKLWHKSVLRASNIDALKNLLLKLESNMRHVALTADWLKPAESAPTLGSARYVTTSSHRIPPKQGTGRKKGRYMDLEAKPSSNAGPCLFWWRGGKVSRELFNCKVLPNSLARKAARQAGCKKIPGVLYPENSELAKRNKCIAWRAAVEASSSVEQLALQVRELDSNIRWDDIGNTNLSLMIEKESKKPFRSFKKVIIRRKCLEGTVVKYLLDFGKRRFIPDIVLKHGNLVEESSSDRKKYWLEETHVPLHLLKVFEEKRIARKSTKINSGKVQESRKMIKKAFKRKGISYLFSKAERSENYQCGHCNKDVLIRDAVSCQYCQGFFHKRHVKKSAGAITSQCTYTCHKCQEGTCRKVNTKKGKSELKKSKKAAKFMSLPSKIRKGIGRGKQATKLQGKRTHQVILPLRRSLRKSKCVPLQMEKTKGRKENYTKHNEGSTEKPKKDIWQNKRTQVYHCYWLNGLRFSRKLNDERVAYFKNNNILVTTGELAETVDQPKCILCGEREITAMLYYIACEICGDWFHGDAFNLTAENMSSVIGFRCHKCRSKNHPGCPHLHANRSLKAKSVGLCNDLESEDTDENLRNKVLLNESSVSQSPPLKEESTVQDNSREDAPDLLVSSNFTSLEDDGVEPVGHAAVDTEVQVVSPLAQSNIEVREIQLSTLNSNQVKNSKETMAPDLHYEVESVPIDSSELASQSILVSGELLGGREDE